MGISAIGFLPTGVRVVSYCLPSTSSPNIAYHPLTISRFEQLPSFKFLTVVNMRQTEFTIGKRVARYKSERRRALIIHATNAPLCYTMPAWRKKNARVRTSAEPCKK